MGSALATEPVSDLPQRRPPTAPWTTFVLLGAAAVLAGGAALVLTLPSAHAESYIGVVPPLDPGPGVVPAHVVLANPTATVRTATLVAPPMPSATFSIPPGGIVQTDIALYATAIGVVPDRDFRVDADGPLQVQAHISYGGRAATDTVWVPELADLGTDYWSFGYDQVPTPVTDPSSHTSLANYLVVTAPTDADVTVTAPVAVPGGSGLGPASIAAGTPTTVRVPGGQSLVLQMKADWTGTHVRSTAPVAVVGGSPGEYVDLGSARDALADTILPTRRLGTEYVACSSLPARPLKPQFDVVRVLATENGTTAWIGAAGPFALSAGQVHEERVTTDVAIRADRPVAVSVLLGIVTHDTRALGDPGMVVLRPTSDLAQEFVFGVEDDPPLFPGPTWWETHLQTLVPTGTSYDLDGAAVTPMRPVPGTAFSCGEQLLPLGAHQLHLDRPGQAYLLGLGGAIGFWAPLDGDLGPRLVDPVADFAWTSAATCVDPSVHFADASGFPVVAGAVWAWDFGDGATSSLRDPVHAFAAPGTYTVTLTVTDLAGHASTTRRDATSIGRPDCCPTLQPIPDLVTDAGRRLRIVPAAVGQRDPLRFQLTSNLTDADEATFDTATGEFVWRTRAADVGRHPFVLTVWESSCPASTAFTVTLQPRPGPPPTIDSDGDGVADDADNCVALQNHDQGDTDRDGRGDRCASGWLAASDPESPRRLGPGAADVDGDGVADAADDCPTTPDPPQADADRDGVGDRCDADRDGDGIAQDLWTPGAVLDNCPDLANPGQEDADGDGVGDACGPAPSVAAPPRSRPAARTAAAQPVGAAFPGGWPGVLALVAGALVVAATRRAGRRGLGWFVACFSRLAHPNALDHPVRARIVDLLAAQPHLHGRELERRLGLGHGAVEHHLRVLRRAGLVAVAPNGGRATYSTTARLGASARSPPDGPHGDAASLPAVLQHPSARALLRRLGRDPVRLAEAGRAAGLSPRAARYHAKRLAGAGLAQRTPTQAWATAQGAAWTAVLAAASAASTDASGGLTAAGSDAAPAPSRGRAWDAAPARS